MTFILGSASLRELSGVDSRLVRVVKRAITITTCDFTVHDGIRSVAEQRRHVLSGVAKTMRSKHLEGKAVDLVPWIDGKPRWWWPQIYQVAAAMQTAAIEENVLVWWGCVWDRPLNSLGPDLQAEGLAYNIRHPGPDFPDGPHYELDR